MKGFAVFDLFAYAFIFLIWAYHMVSLSGMPNYEDFIVSRAVLIPFVEEAASRYVSDCLAYSVVQALDNNTGGTYLIDDVSQADVRSWFDPCMSTAMNELNSAAIREDVVITNVQYPSLNPVCVGGDCNHVIVNGTMRFNFKIPLPPFFLSSSISLNNKVVSISRELNVIDTGSIDLATGREIYRIVVENKKTGLIEVNGVWPK